MSDSQTRIVRQTIGMLSSMIKSGEQHSPASEKMIELANKAMNGVEQRLEAGQVDAVVSGLKGEVVKIGEMYVDDELLTGMFVEISREEFLEQDTNYLYQKVKIKKEAH